MHKGIATGLLVLAFAAKGASPDPGPLGPAPWVGASLDEAAPGAGDWSQTFPVKGAPEVALRVNEGHIKVVAWDQPQVKVTVVANGYQRTDYQVHPRQVGERLEVEVEKSPDAECSPNSAGVQRIFALEVSMPAKGNLDASTGEGVVNLSGLSGKIAATAVSGYIAARNLEGDVNLRTGDGDVSASQIRGSMAVRAGDGNIAAVGRFDVLKLETGDGNVAAVILGGSTTREDWQVRSDGGNINLALPRAFPAELDARTDHGEVHAELQAASDVQWKPKSSSYRAKLGGGGKFVTIHTKGGDIKLEPLQNEK